MVDCKFYVLGLHSAWAMLAKVDCFGRLFQKKKAEKWWMS